MSGVKVTVIIPMKDAAKYCGEAISSILQQEYENWELIVCDDGSTDSSYEIAHQLINAEPRAKLIRHSTSQGVSESLRQMISISSGEYIARMDADDISAPNRLSEQVKYLDGYPNVIAIGACGDIMAEDGTIICPFVKTESCEGLKPHEIPIISPTLMFRKSALNATILPGREFDGIEDIILIKRLQSIGPIRNIQSNLIKYRITPNALSNIPNKLRKERHQIICRALENGYLSGPDAIRLAQIKELRKGPNSDQVYKERLIRLALKNSRDRSYVRKLIETEMQNGHLSTKLFLYWVFIRITKMLKN